MPVAFPNPRATHPITLPDGTVHKGTVFLNNVIDHPNFEIGDFTYYSDFDPPADPAEYAVRLAPYLYPGAPDRVVIGSFCQIAHGTRFITASANHAMDGISSFPFPVFDLEQMQGYAPDRRDIVIGHDCWIGYGAMIAPGARLGNGVIVGAGAVVRGAVPDYAIVTGNPAGVHRMRFDAASIEALNAIAWWNWPHERIAVNAEAIQAADIGRLARA